MNTQQNDRKKTKQQADNQRKRGSPQRNQEGGPGEESNATKENPEQSGLTRGGDPKSRQDK